MRFAIIGCGSMGLRHAVALAELNKRGLGDFELVAVCDINEQRATEMARYSRELGHSSVVPLTSYEQVLEDPSIDAVSVVLPTWLHHMIGSEALLAGKHTIIEKPLAISSNASTMLRKAAEKSKRVLAVSENYRRIASNRAFGSLVSQQRFGIPLSMSMQRVASPDESYKVGDRMVRGASWYREPAKAGSYHVFELGAHEIDLQQFWFGPITAVSGIESTIGGAYNRTLIQLQFLSGMFSQIAFADSTPDVEFTYRQFAGSRGSAFSRCWHAWEDGQITVDGTSASLDEMTHTYFECLGEKERSRFFAPGSFERGAPSVPANPLTYGVGSAYADFAMAIRDSRLPEIGLEEGSDVVAVCEAILRSISEERTVAIVRQSVSDSVNKAGDHADDTEKAG